MTQRSNAIRAVILAGGSGTRLWPLSRAQSPKQFSSLLGNKSLFDATISRIQPLVPSHDVLVVTSEESATGDGYVSLEKFEKLLEPVPRNTAAAIGLAALRYQVEGIDPILIVLPADHVIADLDRFHRALGMAINAAAEGQLVTFGIVPSHAESGYGYIEATQSGEVIPVASFREKPDLATARNYIAAGNYYWNSGMFVWKASAILKEIREHLPSLGTVLQKIGEKAVETSGLPPAIKQHFAEAPSVSVDHGVLERSKNIVMVRGDFSWSDVGSWDAVFDISDKDANGNVLQGNVLEIECQNTLLRSESRLIAALDVTDISVVETPDAILVARRGSSQRVAQVVQQLAARAATEHITPSTVKRPWGSFTVLEEGPLFKIKKIEVRPGGRLSLQRHKHRSEHWVVISGEATVTCNSTVTTLKRNESSFVPAGSLHRLENCTNEMVELIEVQVGSYVGEDDIERFDDHYGRT